MKNDYSFKLLGAALFAGLLLAVINPLDTAPRAERATDQSNVLTEILMAASTPAP